MQYFHSREAKEFVKDRAQHLWRDYSNLSYCHSALPFWLAYYPCSRYLDARYLNRNRSSSHSNGVASVSQTRCCGRTGSGTYVWTTRPHEDRYSTVAASMPPHGQHLPGAIRESNQNGTDDLAYWDFHRHWFCCKPSTEKQTRRGYGPLAGFPLSGRVSRKVV